MTSSIINHLVRGWISRAFSLLPFLYSCLRLTIFSYHLNVIFNVFIDRLSRISRINHHIIIMFTRATRCVTRPFARSFSLAAPPASAQPTNLVNKQARVSTRKWTNYDENIWIRDMKLREYENSISRQIVWIYAEKMIGEIENHWTTDWTNVWTNGKWLRTNESISILSFYELQSIHENWQSFMPIEQNIVTLHFYNFIFIIVSLSFRQRNSLKSRVICIISHWFIDWFIDCSNVGASTNLGLSW